MQCHGILFRTTLTAGFLVCASSLGLAGGVRIVESSGTQNFASIQAAVDAAPDGAVLLVGEGTYSGFDVAGKSLSIFGAPGAAVSVQGTVVVSADAGRTVVIRGLSVQPPDESALPGLSASGEGFLRFEDCTFHGADFDDVIYCYFGGPGRAGPAGAEVSGCPRIAFERCVLIGGRGQDNDDAFEYGCATSLQGGGHGGPGLFAQGSDVALYDCALSGSEGGGATWEAGAGGAGAELDATSVYASATSFAGGWGGQHYTFPVCYSAGGPGCTLANGSAVASVGSSFSGGSGGGVQPDCFNSLVSAPTVEGGSPTLIPGSARTSTIAQSVQGDASTWSVSFQSAPGDRNFLLLATRPEFLPGLARGIWLVPFRDLESMSLLGTSDAAGRLDANAVAPDLSPGPSDPICELRFAQSASQIQSSALLPSRTRVFTPIQFLGSASVLVLIDRDSLPDCNGNGVNDFVDVLEGTSRDVNHNLIPDGCPGG